MKKSLLEIRKRILKILKFKKSKINNYSYIFNMLYVLKCGLIVRNIPLYYSGLNSPYFDYDIYDVLKPSDRKELNLINIHSN